MWHAALECSMCDQYVIAPDKLRLLFGFLSGYAMSRPLSGMLMLKLCSKLGASISTAGFMVTVRALC